MPKINRWFFGFFLTILCPSVVMVGAEAPSLDDVFQKEVVPSAPRAAAPGSDGAEGDPQGVRNPFAMGNLPEAEIAPHVLPEEASGGEAASEIVVTLQGIGYGSKEAYAVIGGDVFYKGEEKKGIKLIEVRKQEVDILVNGGMATIPLFPVEALQRAKDRAKAKGAMENVSVDQPSEKSLSLSGREQSLS